MSVEITDGLSKASTAGAFCQLTDPITGTPMESDGVPAGLVLAGEDSDQWAKAEDDLARKLSREAEKAGRKWRYTPEMQREKALEMLVAVTLGWKGMSYGGSDEFTPDLMREMYRKVKWVREQAEAFIADRASFGGASKTA